MTMLPLPRLTENDRNRFWSKVDKSGDCWIWLASKWARGYGVFTIRGRRYRAHRVSYQLSNDRDALGLVCHTCDNPSCVNPGHLYDGTPSSNMADKIKRGRQGNHGPKNPACGSRNGHSKMTETGVVEIRERYRSWNKGKRSNIAEIAKDYGISASAALRIVNREVWRHV